MHTNHSHSASLVAVNTLVSPAWLAERIHDPNTVVLDATLPPVGVMPAPNVRESYEAAHIPGAQFFDIEEFSDHRSHLPHMLPTSSDFAQKISALGVGENMSVVVYEQAGVFSAARAWWMLKTFGAQCVHVLDGGLKAWVDAGYAVESEGSRKPAASFVAKFDDKAVANFSQVQTLIAQKAQILDARSAARFAGSAPEPRAGLASGHMPGAKNLPFGELTQNGRLLVPEQLREIFISKGIDLNEPIVTTCGSGVTAAVLSLALHLVGATRVSLYDGAWAEYAQQPGVDIKKS